MSDDFNQLRPPGDDDDDRFDWQPDESDSEEQPSKPGDRLGFTQELSWRQDVDKAFSERLDDASQTPVDWQGDPSQPPDEDAPQNAAEADVPDWLTAFTGDQPPESEPAGDLPPWLAELPGEDVAAQETRPTPAEAETSWMQAAGDTGEPPAPHEFPPADDLPPWLQNPAPVSDEPDEPIPGGDVPPWLAGLEEPAEVPAPTDEELLAGLDEALGIVPEQPAAAPPQGLDAFLVDEVVEEDFFTEAAAEQPPAGSSFEDWFSEAAPATRPPAEPEDTIPIPDWFTSSRDFGTLKQAFEQPPKQTPEESEALPDWMGEAAPAGETEEQPAGDLFADWMTTPPEAEAEQEVPAGDLFAGWMSEPPAAETEEPVAAADELPDWLAAAAPAPEQPETAAPKDIFGELGLPTPETGFDFLDNPPAEPAAETGDWFAEEQAASATPDWLGELGEVSPTDAELAAPADADFLAELSAAAGGVEQRGKEPPIEQPSFLDLDSLLESYDAPSAPVADQTQLDTSMENLDRVLSDRDLEQIAARRSPRPAGPDELTPEMPEWLTESGVLVDDTSAAAILRKRTDRERPLEDLDERLQALHDMGLELTAPAEEAPSGDLKTLLPGITQFIPAAPIKTGSIGIAGELSLTPQQAEKIALLRSLVAVEEAEQPQFQSPSALDLTYEAPSLSDITGEEGEEPQPAEEPAPAPYPLPRRRLRIGRLLVALLVTAGVVLPFVFGPLRIGNLPPAQFTTGSRQQAVFDRMDDLAPGDLVMLAAEYGPTGAGELDSLSEALLRHALLKGARPVIISTNPLGLLHVQNILNRLASDEAFTAQVNRPLVANRDYYIIRYLAGSVTGLRAFSENVLVTLSTDITGAATHLVPSSLRDFALITVVAERAEDLRMWAEQVGPLTGKPLVAAVGQSAAPLSEPYVLLNAPASLSRLAGLLVGYGDAYTYREQIEAVAPVEPASIPTLRPTQPPPATVQPADVPPSSDLTASPAGEEADQTPVPTEPGAAEETPPEAATETTAEPGDESDVPFITGVINSTQAVNVREGPGRTFAPVAAGLPGQRVQIIGRNGAGDWLQIRLADGTEGWILASLLDVEEPAAPADGSSSLPDPNAVVSLISDVNLFAFQPEATPEATVGPVREPPLPETSAVAQDVVTTSPTPYRDERWYGMTLGLIVIIAVITVGTVFNVLGGLSRRRRP